MSGDPEGCARRKLEKNQLCRVVEARSDPEFKPAKDLGQGRQVTISDEKINKAKGCSTCRRWREGQKLGHNMVWCLLEKAILKTALEDMGLPESITTNRAGCSTGKIVEVPGNGVLAKTKGLEENRVDRTSMAPSHLRDLKAT